MTYLPKNLAAVEASVKAFTILLPQVSNPVLEVLQNTSANIATEVPSLDSLRFKFLANNYTHIINMKNIALDLLFNYNNTSTNVYSYKIISFNNNYTGSLDICYNSFLGYSRGICFAYKPFLFFSKLNFILLPLLVPILYSFVAFIFHIISNRIDSILNNIMSIISNSILYLIYLLEILYYFYSQLRSLGLKIEEDKPF